MHTKHPGIEYNTSTTDLLIFFNDLQHLQNDTDYQCINQLLFIAAKRGHSNKNVRKWQLLSDCFYWSIQQNLFKNIINHSIIGTF